MGFKSNLSSGEIVEQLVHASRYSQIRNVVFMVIFTQVVVIAWNFYLRKKNCDIWMRRLSIFCDPLERYFHLDYADQI